MILVIVFCSSSKYAAFYFVMELDHPGSQNTNPSNSPESLLTFHDIQLFWVSARYDPSITKGLERTGR